MPSYLYGRWPEVEGRLRLSLGVLLMLAYEGVLVPAGRAGEAGPGAEVREALERLAKDARWARVVVLDSRTVDQLKELVGVEGVAYAGLDGMVVDGPWLSLAYEPAQRLRSEVAKLRDELVEALRTFSGVGLVDRGLSLSIDYSKAPRGLGRRVSRAVFSLLSARGGFRLLRKRKVLEVTPDVDWDRGRAVELLLAQEGLRELLPVYVGGDEVDEPAFRALGAGGLTVVVGRRPRSYARLYVKNVEEVGEFVRRVARLSSPLG